MARIKVNTVNENIAFMNDELKSQLNNEFTNDKRSAWYMFMYPIARLMREKMERQQIQIDKMNLLNCVGYEIDEHLANSPFFFKRKQESKATVKVEIIGGKNIELTLGDLIIEAKDGLKYRLIDSGTLTDSGTFTFECETSGEQGNKKIGELIKFSKIVSGVYDFKQVENSAGGQEQESDNAYLERWFLSRNESEWNLDGIIAEVLACEGVTSAYGNENKTMVIDGLGLEPKSIAIVVNGGRNEDIARAIWKKKDTAIQTNGNTTVIIKDSQGIDRGIKFFRPEVKEFEVKIDFTLADGVNITKNTLLDIVKKYLASSTVGGYITSYQCESEYIRAIYPPDKLLNIDVTFSLKGANDFKKVQKLAFNEVAVYAE